MVKRTRIAVWSLLLLAPLAACGGGDERDTAQEKAVDGTFVGKLSGSDAFVAVVASPPTRGQDRREVTMYLTDGGRLSESLDGSALGNSFEAKSRDDDATAEGKLRGDAVTGSVKLPDGKTVRYKAGRATGASGLYDLTVSSKGQLSGASAAGVGLTSKSTLRLPGTGILKFADGKRRAFDVIGEAADDSIRLRAGQVHLIVLPSGDMKGAGVSQPKTGDGGSRFFIRSTK